MGTGVGITAPFGRLLRGLRQSRRLTIEQAGKVHLHLAHALARLGERAEATAEYQAVVVLESRVPADVRDEAHAGLTALTAGRAVPLIRFVR
ncbi:hypothetical protein ACIQXA_07850 [Streptomyces massasporeus]|uniref:hypothetical protein n=1 Tax=Streptomyces massasporeus TaxID=67324 RepID=UPI0037F821AD